MVCWRSARCNTSVYTDCFPVHRGNVAYDWYKSGVLDKVFERLQHERLLRMRLEAVCLDSSCVKVHPDGKSNAKKPWPYDVELYKRRNEVERLFCRVKRFRRIATRYDKLDVIFLGFLLFAFVVDFLLLC